MWTDDITSFLQALGEKAGDKLAYNINCDWLKHVDGFDHLWYKHCFVVLTAARLFNGMSIMFKF